MNTLSVGKMARSALKAAESNLVTQPGQRANDGFCFPLGDLQRALLVPVIGRRVVSPRLVCLSVGSGKMVAILEGYRTGIAGTPVSPGSWV